MSPARARRRDDLILLMIAQQSGQTVDDMMVALGCDHPQVNEAIRDVRLWLGDFDEVNLICDPQGTGQRWLYRLVGTLDEMRPWAANRVADSASRIRTMASMLASVVSATDGRSIEGRKARVMERSLRRLVEDLDVIGVGP